MWVAMSSASNCGSIRTLPLENATIVRRCFASSSLSAAGLSPNSGSDEVRS